MRPCATSPFADANPNPYAPSAYPGYAYREMHRGGAVLALGIVSLMACQLVAIAPIIMGLADLDKMKRGTMDPSGRGLTTAGLVIGFVAVGLLVLQVLMIAAMIAGG